MPVEALLRDGLGVLTDDQLARVAISPLAVRALNGLVWQAMAAGTVGELWDEACDSISEVLPPTYLGSDAHRRIVNRIKDLENDQGSLWPGSPPASSLSFTCQLRPWYLNGPSMGGDSIRSAVIVLPAVARWLSAPRPSLLSVSIVARPTSTLIDAGFDHAAEPGLRNDSYCAGTTTAIGIKMEPVMLRPLSGESRLARRRAEGKALGVDRVPQRRWPVESRRPIR